LRAKRIALYVVSDVLPHLSFPIVTPLQQRPAATHLVSFANSLSLTGSEQAPYGLVQLARQLLARAQANLSSNNAVIPVLQTFEILLEADALDRLQETEDGMKVYASCGSWKDVYSILNITSFRLSELKTLVSRQVGKLKNTQRIMLCMQMYVFSTSCNTLLCSSALI
jgi:tubulin-specific chaperone D